MVIAALFLFMFFLVNWSLKELFITPDQQGRLLMARGSCKEAAEVFENPILRGTAFYRNGDFKEAAAAFGQDNSLISLYNRANALLMLGKYDKAIFIYEQLLLLKPDWLEARENHALARARKEKMMPPEDDDQQEQVADGKQLSDQEMRAIWLRQIETEPEDFLRAKFAYQEAVSQEPGAGKQGIGKN